MPDGVIELIEDKADELDELKAKIEAKLFRLTLTTSRGERVNPTNDYLGWLAMSLFRQWVAENTTPPPTPILKTTPHASRNPPPAGPQPPTAHPRTASGETASQPIPSSSRPTILPPQNSGRVYRLIGSTNPQSYLPHDELKRFLKLTPSSNGSSALYNRDNMRRFERKIDEVKNLARDVVKPLTRNCLELDLKAEGGGGLPYLTCIKVEEGDLPWD